MVQVMEIGQVSELAAYCIGMACMAHSNNNRWNIIIYLMIAAVLTWVVYRAIKKKEAASTRQQ